MANLAAANLWQRKTRSAISVFGIAIGIALLLVLKGMLLGTISEVTDRMKNTGTDIFIYRDMSVLSGTSKSMPLRWMDDIQKAMPDRIESIVPMMQTTIQKIGEVNQSNRVWGIRSGDLGPLNIRVITGRVFKDGKNEMLLDERLAERAKVKIGDKVNFMGRSWEMVGITEVGVGVRVYAPFDVLQELQTEEGAEVFAIKLFKGVDAVDVAHDLKDVEVVLNTQTGEKIIFPAEPLVTATLFETFREKAGIVDIFANYVTFVALIISFLMILLTMYTVVVERTRDIGILKSLGASRMFIARNIIIESLALCALGVVTGVGLSMGAAWFIPRVSLLNVMISPAWIGIAAAMGIAGGVLGAIVPAMLAASKDPVVAITYE